MALDTGNPCRYDGVVFLDLAATQSVETMEVSNDNQALSQHVHDILSVNKSSEFIDASIYVRDFIPSLPSILVIDEQYAFFPCLQILLETQGMKRIQ
jgi:hypothetical protein